MHTGGLPADTAIDFNRICDDDVWQLIKLISIL
jgi:hypothetical protein